MVNAIKSIYLCFRSAYLCGVQGIIDFFVPQLEDQKL